MESVLNLKIDEYFNEMVRNLQEFIMIPSVLDEDKSDKNYPFGPKIDEALKWILNKSREMGLATKNVDNYAGYAETGKGIEMVGILGHIDVVPAGTGWSAASPFGGEIKEGKLYGRGSVDDKGPTLAALYALKAIKESRLPVSKRARLIIGTDEETEARGLKYYLEKEETPIYGFSPDAEFPIIYAEKGILRFEIIKSFTQDKGCRPFLISVQGGTRLNVVPDCAEAIIKGVDKEKILQLVNQEGFAGKILIEDSLDGIHIKAEGLSAHASYPEDGENAIQMLLSFLSHISFGGRKAKTFIDAAVARLKMEHDGRTLGISCSDKVSGALTINLGIADFNAERGSLKFDVRYPVTADGNQIIEKLKEIAMDLESEFRIIQHKLPLYVEPDTPFIKKLQNIYKEMTGAEAELISIGGGTYCRYIKNTVSFGPVFPGQKELAHQKDEYILLEDLRKISKIYVQAIYELIK
ncbi:MAG: dipeptidase PepV [Tepidanaerobacteraceae bacterium]|jgi:succinyl-diaminopimelate desuccinylase